MCASFTYLELLDDPGLRGGFAVGGPGQPGQETASAPGRVLRQKPRQILPVQRWEGSYRGDITFFFTKVFA
jgi:hypothetical protein